MTTRSKRLTMLACTMFMVAVGAGVGHAQTQCQNPITYIAGINAAFGAFPILLYDFAIPGDPRATFIPEGAAGFNNGRGVEVIGNEVFYTFLGGGAGPSDSIHVTLFPFDFGFDGRDTRSLPNPRPTAGVTALSFRDGLLYALTGFPADPAQVFGLDPKTGNIVKAFVTIGSAATSSSDGFTVLPSGRFLINSDVASCTFNQFDPISGGVIAGTALRVPGPAGATPTQCTGVDTDGEFLYFAVDGNGFVKTTLDGTYVSKTSVATNSIEDISLVHEPTPADNTPPTTTAGVSQLANAKGWNNSSVTVILSAVDPTSPCGAVASGVKSITYSETGNQNVLATPVNGPIATVPISAQGATTVSYHATDGAGNVESPDGWVVVYVDVTPPVTTASVSPLPNAAGWNNAAVTVNLAAADPPAPSGAGSGVASISYVETGAQSIGPTTVANAIAAVPVAAEGATNVSFQATDVAGNIEPQAPPLVVKVDRTLPVITFTGNAGTYNVAQTITIACAATDALSGIASDTCASASLNGVPAYTLGVGVKTLQASATDRAGNTTSASTRCSVVVTVASLCTLQTQFVQGSANYAKLTSTQKAAVNSTLALLCQTLGKIVPGLTPTQKANLLARYKQGLDALVQSGWLTASQATILLNLARAL
jgi:hypothetical protein